MKFRWAGFNIYLATALGLLLLCGCKSAKTNSKGLATLRVHAEMLGDAAGRTTKVQVFRAQPFFVTIEKTPFLTEAFVKHASVADTMGGFALQVQFERQGTWLLEQYSSALRGKHIVIFSQFVPPGEKKQNPDGRWLAAPLVSTRITDGLLVFTPDATRAEAEQIANGLNAVAKKNGTDKAM